MCMLHVYVLSLALLLYYVRWHTGALTIAEVPRNVLQRESDDAGCDWKVSESIVVCVRVFSCGSSLEQRVVCILSHDFSLGTWLPHGRARQASAERWRQEPA